MKELVLTHNINGIANVAIVDYSKYTVNVKRVPNSSPMLKSLLQSGKIRKCYSELRDTGDVWLMKQHNDWLSVSDDGIVSNTMDSNRLEKDDSAFLATFVELPVWSIKSKVFVAKLLYTVRKVKLSQYIQVAGKLSPEVAQAFSRMSERVTEASESVDTVSSIEIWGHTLNTLYKSNMELLDPSLLCTLNWLQPQVCNDAVLWRGMTEAQDRTLYVYLKGDAVLYVGYDTLKEVEFNRHTTLRELGDVLTFDNLITPTCAGLLEVSGAYLVWEEGAKHVKVCNELLRDDAINFFTEFLVESLVLVDVRYILMENGKQLQNSWLYDVVNNKIYIFKSWESHKLGTYYGEMTVEEWRVRKENYIGTE